MKALKYFLLVLLLVLAGLTYAYANVARLVLVEYSSLNAIENNVYVSESLSSNDRLTISNMLASARERIAIHYGEPIAKPLIVVLSSHEEKHNFGLYDAPGKFLFAPWGSYLLLSLQEANIDVAAHELVHAEIVNRVGYVKRQLKIPTWFDEGVAMQVDYRPKYDSSKTISLPEFERIISLATPSEFWTNNKSKNIDNYRGAKAAAFELFKHTEMELYPLLAEIEAGNNSILPSAITKTNKALHRTGW